MKLLEYIRKGISYTDFFIYDNYTIKIRPINSLECDKAEHNSLLIKEVDSKLAKFIMQIKLGKISLTTELNDLPSSLYTALRRYYMEIDYWIVYYSMKDFQPEDFKIDDVRKMRYVHEIARKVLDMSSNNSEVIMKIVSTEKGQELARIIYEYHVPLTDSAWKLTKLQEEFLYWSNSSAPKYLGKSWRDIDFPGVDKLRNVAK